MIRGFHSSFLRTVVALFIVVCAASALGVAQTGNSQVPATGNRIFVHSKFGGQIFGFDIDQNGTEGVLAEAQTLSNGNVLAAVETFDQTTGKILSVLVKTQTQDDYVTLGVAETSVGLVEHEHVVSLLNVQRTFQTINPLSGNKFSGKWTPPIGQKHLITSVTRNQGTDNVAVFAEDNSGNFIPYIFSSNVGTNTFGPVIQITDSANFGSIPPPIALNSATNVAYLGGGNGCFGCSPVIGVADLTSGTFTEFGGQGFGFVNGIAVDSVDNVVCTTTEDDAAVEFYDIDNNAAFSVVLPNSSADPQFYSGADVQFDPINKLFFVAQPNSSESTTGSTIYVFDIKGNLRRFINGFSFSNAFNVIPAHIALNPSTRTGFVDGPNAGVTDIESFSY